MWISYHSNHMGTGDAWVEVRIEGIAGEPEKTIIPADVCANPI